MSREPAAPNRPQSHLSSGWAAAASISSPTVTPGQTIVIHGVITSPTSLNGVGIAYSLHDIARNSMGQIGFGNENGLVAGQAWPRDWYVTVPCLRTSLRALTTWASAFTTSHGKLDIISSMPRPISIGHSSAIAFHRLYCSLRSSAARSPITTQGAMVFPVVTRGMIDPSAIRRLLTP